ncbi:hypothetical protein DY000_02052264 [Brassica cretica]|uniref:Uncharacterized protein n=1 Tax=Brassica cretica TaxID=69181 RepID=A0ABQ7ABC0_BRACR|nr:hypothetical protein DY000_02052264 [Brassica cretica]
MYLPRHNCTVTGTQGVHYCGFPIAMKAWMGTSESVPSHDWLGSGSDPRKTTVRIKMRSMSSEKIKFLVVGVRPCKGTLECENQTVNYLTVTEFINFLAVTGSSYRVVTKQFGGWLLSRLLNCWRSWESREKAARGWLERLEGGYVRLSNRPVSFNEISADQRGDIPALYGSGETRERDIPREGDSDRKDRESWPEGGPGSQLLAAARLAYCRYWKAGWRHSQGRMAVRCTEGIEGCRAEYVLTGLGVINDWFWNASKAGVLSILDGWLETKPSLFVHGHVGMIG